MAERSYYISFKKFHDTLYALDKDGFMNTWNMKNGQLLERKPVRDLDLRGYEVDRKVYDKGWFNYTLLHKPAPQMDNDSILGQSFN